MPDQELAGEIGVILSHSQPIAVDVNGDRVDLDDYALAAMRELVRIAYATEPYRMRPDEIARRAFEIAAAMEQERQRRAHGGP